MLQCLMCGHRNVLISTITQWDIEPSNGGYYSIQSHDHGTLMVSSDVPRKGDNIYRYTDTFANLWEVKETTVTGHYTCVVNYIRFLMPAEYFKRPLSISPSLGSNLFWGLADGEIDTPVGPIPSLRSNNDITLHFNRSLSKARRTTPRISGSSPRLLLRNEYLVRY